MKEKFEIFFTKQIYRMVHFDLHDSRKSVFLAGSARSGTTWLQDIINYDNEFRILFEPFHPENGELFRTWKPSQYLRVGNKSPIYLDPMKDLLQGKVKDSWINSYNRRLFSQKRLIKAVYSNLFLYWMKRNFPEIPIILILRHPCAVANSKMNIVKRNFIFTTNPLNRFLDQDDLMEDFLHSYKAELMDDKTVFETFIFMWCIENLIPLKQFQPGEICLTFYENICVNPESEIKRVFTYINKPYSIEVMDKVKTPGVMSRKNSAINLGTDLISSWRKNISKEEIYRALEILNLFGLEKVYNDNDTPQMEGDVTLMTLLQKPEL